MIVGEAAVDLQGIHPELLVDYRVDLVVVQIDMILILELLLVDLQLWDLLDLHQEDMLVVQEYLMHQVLLVGLLVVAVAVLVVLVEMVQDSLDLVTLVEPVVLD